ncbi:MAG: hypothetical protein HOV81_00690 [Kofleriaceae bacterium]|nr:hypothetical protein [Kofleriaceae bacterium]
MRVALALLFALAACGDDAPAKMPDGGMEPDGGGMMETTLTSYVKDLILNQTTATAAPKPYSEFGSLPDPDGDANNVGAYSSLF